MFENEDAYVFGTLNLMLVYPPLLWSQVSFIKFSWICTLWHFLSEKNILLIFEHGITLQRLKGAMPRRHLNRKPHISIGLHSRKTQQSYATKTPRNSCNILPINTSKLKLNYKQGQIQETAPAFQKNFPIYHPPLPCPWRSKTLNLMTL